MNAVRAVSSVPTVTALRAILHSPSATRQISSSALSSPPWIAPRSHAYIRASPSATCHFNGRRQWQCSAAASDGTAAVVTESAPVAAEPAEVDPKLAEALEIKVGKILKAYKHPEADSLYVEEVDLGEEGGPRTICSGLVKYVPLEDLEDRAVLVLANLKPRNMRGVKSNGMLLAASDAAHENVELLSPPEGAVPGERVWFGGEEEEAAQGEAMTANQVQKKKVWEAVQPLLKTDEQGVAVFKGRPMRVPAGVVRSKSLTGANIS